MSKIDESFHRPASNRPFGVSLSIGLALGTGLALMRGHVPVAIILGLCSATSLVLGLIFPHPLNPLRLTLEWLGGRVAALFAIVILSVFYYSFFSAFATMVRLFRKDSFRDRHPRWHPTPPEENNPDSLKRLF